MKEFPRPPMMYTIRQVIPSVLPGISQYSDLPQAVQVMKTAHQPIDQPRAGIGNREIASRLDEVAELLDAQQANPFRVRAYHVAAETVRALKRPVIEIIDSEGLPGLMALEGIGESLAGSIEQLARTSRLKLLERLRGETTPEDVFTTVAGIGPEMAARIHEHLGIETLLELEAAAYDGRLATVPGFGAKRIRAVRESLSGRYRLGRRLQVKADDIDGPRKAERAHEPPVDELLDVDAEYRRKAEAGRLIQIAPKRFNPTRAAWLPILHTHRGARHYTALYSNTARAHELGAVRDWVVIYRDDDAGAGQWTAVTSQFGELKGERIIRGREDECLLHYRGTPVATPHAAG